MATIQLKDLKFNSPVPTNAAGQLEGSFNVASGGFTMTGKDGTISGFSLKSCDLYGGDIDGWFAVGSGFTFGCGTMNVEDLYACGRISTWDNVCGGQGPSSKVSYYGMVQIYDSCGQEYVWVPAYTTNY